jgi:hypothetical protein
LLQDGHSLVATMGGYLSAFNVLLCFLHFPAFYLGSLDILCSSIIVFLLHPLSVHFSSTRLVLLKTSISFYQLAQPFLLSDDMLEYTLSTDHDKFE